jgi:hypothetical protein
MSTNRQHDPMTGYTKLFASILDSTIWREDDKTRIVWITMLAMSNQWGDVQSSIPGLADRARVSIPEAEKALKVLAEPDEYSRTKDHDGRRIQEVDGGWRILNHGKYREKMSQDERREYLARKQREFRARRKQGDPVNIESTDVNSCGDKSTPSTHTEADSEAKAVTPKSVRVSKPREAEGYSQDFEAFWCAYPNKKAKVDAWKVWKKIVNHPGVFVLIEAIKTHTQEDSWQRGFIPHPATWLNARRWEDEPTLKLEPSEPAAPIRATMKL